MNALATKVDGTRAAPSYFNCRRGAFRDALKYAVELKIFDGNPITQTREAWAKQKKTRTTVDRRCVINPQQAAALLQSVAEVPADITPGQYARLNAPRLKAFFAVMYYAALRPEEAVDLRLDNLDIPAEGWGSFISRVRHPTPVATGLTTVNAVNNHNSNTGAKTKAAPCPAHRN